MLPSTCTQSVFLGHVCFGRIPLYQNNLYTECISATCVLGYNPPFIKTTCCLFGKFLFNSVLTIQTSSPSLYWPMGEYHWESWSCVMTTWLHLILKWSRLRRADNPNVGVSRGNMHGITQHTVVHFLRNYTMYWNGIKWIVYILLYSISCSHYSSCQWPMLKQYTASGPKKSSEANHGSRLVLSH
jgi:hypothetical protein